MGIAGMLATGGTVCPGIIVEVVVPDATGEGGGSFEAGVEPKTLVTVANNT